MARHASHPGDQRAERAGASLPGVGRHASRCKRSSAICSNVRLAYVGDGNNVAHSLMLAAAQRWARSSRWRLRRDTSRTPEIIERGRRRSPRSPGAMIEVTNDAVKAVAGADAVYTDVWASMGQEDEAAERGQIFAPYQVNAEVVLARRAKHAVFMHCLPAHRGEEVTAAVIDSPRSVVFDQAENRMHIQKAILVLLLGSGMRTASRQGVLMREKVVLAYSGGLDTSIIIPWLKENYDYDVIAMVADVGQGDDIDAVVEKAYKTGACKVIVEDLREEFLTRLCISRAAGRRGVRAQVSARELRWRGR